jgi:hypothetical protein
MARAELASVLLGAVVVLGITATAFFFLSKNGPLKRKYWPPYLVVAGLVVAALLWFRAPDPTVEFLYVLPVFGLILFLNFRTVAFCDACGKTTHSSNPFAPAKFCPKCGVALK